MDKRPTIHFVEPSTRLRAELSRIALGLGYHAEVYCDCAEFTERPPDRGIILARDEQRQGGIERLMRRFDRAEISLPVIALAENPTVERTVAAVKAGALDYLSIPLDLARFDFALRKVEREADAFGQTRRRMYDARNRIAHLSNREREVLGLLVGGLSNKEIARELEISPRTVEIHRSNMMAKLGARHAAEAVRMSLDARMEMPRAA